MENFTDGIKKLLLAGIGAAALTAEKSQELLDEMVKKGELTVEQGKELNKELRHNISKTIKDRKEPEGFADKIAAMSREELDALKYQRDHARKAQEYPGGTGPHLY